ncbi:DUF2860 domain-containing protein [Parasalinivibrio latis]|uniref:DUF2860 family protein n=1 Tax=Parasalinivibrio latis TaxID=2952610 RepID=UPI0030E448D4
MFPCCRVITLFLCISSISGLVAKTYANEPGFHGELAFNTGFTSGRSQFNTDEKASPATNKADTDTNILFFPLGELNYTTPGGKNTFYIGTAREDIALGNAHFEIGYSRNLSGRSKLSIGLIPGLFNNETWEDPYTVGSGLKRQETDQSVTAVRVKWDNISKSNFSFETGFGIHNIDSERSGEYWNNNQTAINTGLLRRDADVIYTKLSYRYALKPGTMVQPAVSYSGVNADGKAMAYDQLNLQLALFKAVGNHRLALSTNMSVAHFDTVHPIYNKTRKDKAFGFFLAHEYPNLFGYQSLSFISLLGYDESDSNITFYDEEGWLVSAGISLTF